MGDDPENREQEIFSAAIALPESERAAYIFHACNGNPQLELRIHRLIAAHEYAQDASSRVSPPPYPLDDPDNIGPYRLLERIGEGGMGVVYLAEQMEPVRRRVALKIIKLGMDTREVIARFETERQALAMMNHQNIARILDVGATEGGRPYFVMEYVRGISITGYCNKMRLPVEARLRLFCDVCLAIQHAHQKGIIHRDIKPSNVLVTVEQGTPVPKIIDFGVAKATDYRLSELTLHTRIGHFIGTPEYMSPEQAEMSPLNVDTRSDVYSLGAVLYELLIGVRPLEFDDELPGFVEIQHAIRSVEPASLADRLAMLEPPDAATIAEQRACSVAALARQVRGELSWIAARAIAKDPSRRYQAAQSLGRDVERYLNDEAVEASPESVIYRGQKFIRRHRGALAIASLTVVALLAGLGTATFGLLEAQTERDVARRATADAEAVTAFLAHMLTAADPEELGKDVTVREVLDQAAAVLSDEFADSPLIEARLRGSIGATYRALGQLDEAEQNLLRRLQIHEQQLPQDHPDRLDSMHELGRVYHRQGRFREAEQIYSAAYEGRRLSLGPEHRETLSSMNNLALVYYFGGRYAEAHVIWEDLYEIDRRTSGPDHPSTLSAMNNLGLTLRYYGRYDEARDIYERTVESRRRVLGEDHPATLIAIHNLAAVHVMQGDLTTAEQMLRALIDTYDRVLGPEHPRTLLSRDGLGQVLNRMGRLDEAERLLTETLDANRRVRGELHQETLNTEVNLGQVYLNQERPEAAQPLLRHAVENLPERSPNNPRLADYRAYLGRCLLRLGRYEEAERVLLTAHTALQYNVDQGATMFEAEFRQVLTDLAELYGDTDRVDEAQSYRRALAARDSS